MGLVSAGRRSSRGDDRPLLLDRLNEMVIWAEQKLRVGLIISLHIQLGEDYPGLPKVLEQLLRYQPDKRIPASSVSQVLPFAWIAQIVSGMCVHFFAFSTVVFIFNLLFQESFFRDFQTRYLQSSWVWSCNRSFHLIWQIKQELIVTLCLFFSILCLKDIFRPLIPV